MIAPAATNFPLGFVTDVPLFSYTWTGTEPAGTYVWYGILTRAGTSVLNPANWVGFDYEVFTFTA